MNELLKDFRWLFEMLKGGDNKLIPPIRLLRQLTFLGLKDARFIVDNLDTIYAYIELANNYKEREGE